MAHFDNYAKLPRRYQAMVRKMLLNQGLRWTFANLAEEALKLRLFMGWFVFEFPSTRATVSYKTENRFDALDPEMPVKRLDFDSV